MRFPEGLESDSSKHRWKIIIPPTELNRRKLKTGKESTKRRKKKEKEKKKKDHPAIRHVSIAKILNYER